MSACQQLTVTMTNDDDKDEFSHRGEEGRQVMKTLLVGPSLNLKAGITLKNMYIQKMLEVKTLRILGINTDVVKSKMEVCKNCLSHKKHGCFWCERCYM